MLTVAVTLCLRHSSVATPAPLQPLKIENEAVVYSRYAGSQSCAPCHAQAFEAWKNSHHARAERPLSPALDASAFEPPRRIQHGTQSSEVSLTNGHFQLLTTVTAARRETFAAERVAGVEPLRQFLIPASGGRFQVTELAVDSKTGEWFDIFGKEDRQPGEWGHWTGRGMTWNSMCASCHNTRVRKNYDVAADTYRTTVAEQGVGCESCHGPAAEHVRWRQQHPGSTSHDPTLAGLTKEQMLSVCGSCHARRAELTDDFHPGENFLDHFILSIPDETDLFYPDGQVREEDYEYTSFLASRMGRAGVRCEDCHSPHSSKLLGNDNNLCLRCHSGSTPPGLNPPAPKIEPVAHTFHALGKPGSQCVDCHMPQTVYMQRHARRDHGFTIPDPLLTMEHGIPNACNRCHTDRSAEWAWQSAQKWYGSRMERPTRFRARTLARACAGDRTAVAPLQKMLREENIPLWRVAAAGLLKAWRQEPAVEQALLSAFGDTEPLVRVMAVRAWEPLAQAGGAQVEAALNRLLTDPVRAVRVEAAWSLRSHLDTNLIAAQELLHSLAHNNDRPLGRLQTGVYYYDRGDNAAALRCFERALNWDPNSAPLRQALAVSLGAEGKQSEAIRELEIACRLAPKESEYPFKLGLALNEAGKQIEAVAALEKAVELEPQFARAWYNLGLACSAVQNNGRALEALSRAEAFDPTSAQIPYARATILARLGRTEEARTAARHALELKVDFREAVTLLQALPP